MKAIRVYEFGAPEVMKLDEVDKPVPKEDEILVKMYASGVNPADYIIREGGNELLKPLLKLPMGLGLDGAGIVEETGSQITNFKKGDKVYGIPNMLQETYAEFIAAKASQFALMPENVSFNEAGAIPSCALMAWDGITFLGNVQSNQRVLIHGAAGGIGSLAVQFAKTKGAYVVGTASENNFDFLKDIGADEVIDYNNKDFANLLHGFDVAFEAAPVRSDENRLAMAAALNENAKFVSVQLPNQFSQQFLDELALKHAEAKMIMRNIDVSKALADTAKLIEEGKVKITVSKVYSLENAAEAHRDIETKHVRGKIVLEIRKEAVATDEAI